MSSSEAPRRANDDRGDKRLCDGSRGRRFGARRKRGRDRTGREARIVAGAARRRRQAGAVLSAADGDRAARLFSRRGARRGDFRLPRRRPRATGLDRRQRRRGDRGLRPHDPDAGEGPADRRRGGQFPGYVLGVLSAKMQSYRSPADLKGMKIGVSAPGSSTYFMVQHLMVKHGLRRDDASFVGIGASASAVAAVQRGEIDAIVNVDPVINLLESQGLIKVVADTRTPAGTRDVFGGAYPAAVLYAPRSFVAEKPRTTQALVNAFVRGLRWIAGRSADEVAAVMPPDYA